MAKCDLYGCNRYQDPSTEAAVEISLPNDQTRMVKLCEFHYDWSLTADPELYSFGLTFTNEVELRLHPVLNIPDIHKRPVVNGFDPGMGSDISQIGQFAIFGENFEWVDEVRFSNAQNELVGSVSQFVQKTPNTIVFDNPFPGDYVVDENIHLEIHSDGDGDSVIVETNYTVNLPVPEEGPTVTQLVPGAGSDISEIDVLSLEGERLETVSAVEFWYQGTKLFEIMGDGISAMNGWLYINNPLRQTNYPEGDINMVLRNWYEFPQVETNSNYVTTYVAG